MGLHLTLTSEWKHYRWGPVAPRERVPGLVDPEGYLWHGPEQVREHARPEEVEIEIRAQIARAIRLGLRPTHLDSHMGTLFEDFRFFEVYTRVARDTGIVPMIPAPTPDILREVGQPLADQYREAVKRLASSGYVVIDRLVLTLTETSLDARQKEFERLVEGLKPGLTELICHLAEDGEEIRHISGAWQRRVHDYAVMMSPRSRAVLREQSVALVGYRELGKLFRPG
jgi:hypothetical protein